MKKKIQTPAGVIIIFLFLLFLSLWYLKYVFFLIEIISTPNLTQVSFSKAPVATEELRQTLGMVGIPFTDFNVKIFFVLTGLFTLGFCVLLFIFAYKFYRGKNWARVVILVCSFFIALIMIIRTIVNGFTSIPTLSKFIVSFIIGIYLLKSKNVRKFFNKSKKVRNIK